MVQNIISSLGGGSGIDTLALVDSLVAAEKAPREAVLDTKNTTFKTQISGYGALRSALSGIQDSVKLLADADTFNGRNVAFPDSALILPNSVESEALAGEYTIEVLGLASAQSLSAGGFSATNAVVGSGTLSFSFGDWAADGLSFSADADKAVQNLTIDASNNTLSGIRDAINQADFGVQASIVEDAGSYSLQLTSASGATNELQIGVVEGAPSGLAALSYEGFPPVGGMTQNQEGANASLKVNGLQVTRASNQINDVIGGLDFTLTQKSAANETVTISITEDKSVGEQTIRDFVEIYNEFLSTTGSLTARVSPDADAADQTPGSLSSDPSAKAMVNQVRSLISQTVTGLSGNYTALASVGIQTQLDGTLEIDAALFRKAVDTNYSALTSLFTGASASSDARIEVARTKATTAAGSYAVEVTTQPAKGFVSGNAITADDLATLNLNPATGVFAGGLNTGAGDYSFKISVDGTESNLISLSGNYANTDEFMADLQAKINGDIALSGASAGVDISYDAGTGSFTTTSRIYGAASTVSFSEISADMGMFGMGGGATSGFLVAGAIDDTPASATELGTAGRLVMTGAINDTALSATDLGTRGSLVANPNDANLSFVAAADTFDIEVDGFSAGTIALDGSYASFDAIATDLEGQINTALAGSAVVSVAHDGTQFTFTSDSGGSSSTVEILSTSSALVTNLGLVPGSGTAGVDDESFTTALDTSGGGYNLNITIDGTESGLVSLTGTYATTEELRADLETQINADAALTTAGASVVVAYDAAGDKFTFSSASSGNASTVDITAVGVNMVGLGIGAQVGVAGDDETFVTQLDTSGGSYNFDYLVDGLTAGSINLNGMTFDTTEDILDELQSQFTDVNAGVTVSYDASGQRFVFTSDATGTGSDFDITGTPGVDIAKLGISAASGNTGRDATISTVGIDVVGSIDGEAAFGVGQVLLPTLGSPLAGLSLKIAPGASTATITLARGFSNEISNVLDAFLKNNGLIAERETRLKTRLDDVKDDRSDLDRRMEVRHTMLTSQFLAMERIIASLNTISSSLDGLLDSLPFTAKKQ